MNFSTFELHNIAEVEADHGFNVGKLHRVPRAIANTLSPRGRWVALETAGSELRFVTEAPTCRLTLCATVNSPDPHRGFTNLHIYCGDHLYADVAIELGKLASLELNYPEKLRTQSASIPPRRYHPRVWRVCFERATIFIHALDCFGYPVRPPDPDEKPAISWLAHGSSITHGGVASRHVNTYVQQAAWRLGVDPLNLGLSGACHLETPLVDWIVQRDDWHIATFELGINMVDSFEAAEFERRVTYLASAIGRAGKRDRATFITMFLCEGLFDGGKDPRGEKFRRFDAIVREVAQRQGIACLEGKFLLSQPGGLSADLLHPGDHGHFEMGENLARALAARMGGVDRGEAPAT